MVILLPNNHKEHEMQVDVENDKIDRIKLRLATEIQSYKDANGLSQAKIAEMARTNQPRVSRILNGDFYAVTVDDLIKINLRLGTGFKLIDLAEK